MDNSKRYDSVQSGLAKHLKNPENLGITPLTRGIGFPPKTSPSSNSFFKSMLIILILTGIIIPGIINAYSACTNNFVGGTCVGNIKYAQGTTTLTSDVYVTGNVIINPFNTVITNGFSFYLPTTNATGGNFLNLGTIITGNLINGGAAPGAGTLNGLQGGNVVTSFAGSGGSAGTISTTCSGAGGNTISHGGFAICVAGTGNNGAQPASPSITNANTVTMSAAWQNYLSSAGGGSSPSILATAGSPGANGINGIFIEANRIYPGTILAYGNNGFGGLTTEGGSGGSGGAIALFEYNSVIGSTASVSVYGGIGGTGGVAGADDGGNGGNGRVVSYRWTSVPIIIPVVAGAITPSNPSVNLGQSITFQSGTVQGGTSPYTYQWYQSASNPGAASCNSANAIGGATSSTYTKTPPSVGSGRWYTYNVIDANGNSACSAAVQLVTVSPETITLVASNTIVDVGQRIRLTVSSSSSIGNFMIGILNYSDNSYITNLTVPSSGSNSILIKAGAPTQITLGQSHSQNYTLIPITSLSSINSTAGFDYALTINLKNFSKYTANNLENVYFQYQNGTLIPSFLIGNLTNPVATFNLNLDVAQTWLLKMNQTVPQSQNEQVINQTLLNNLNYPSCNTPDGEVSDPTAPHGLFYSYEYGTTPSATEIARAVNDSSFCGAEIGFLWANLDTGTQGSINFATINSSCSIWWNASDTCEIVIEANNYGTGPTYPSRMDAAVGTNYVQCGTQGDGQGDGSDEPIAYYWLPAWNINYTAAVDTLVSHNWGANRVVVRVGTGVGGEAFPFKGNATCTAAWRAIGFTQAKYLSYQVNMTENVSMHSVVPVNYCLNENQTSSSSYQVKFATGIVNASAGLCQLGWSPVHYLTPWYNNARSDVDLNYLAQLFQGKTYIAFQSQAKTIASGGSNAYLAATLVPQLWFGQMQIYEVSSQDAAVWEDPGSTGYSATCPIPFQNSGTEQCHLAYNTTAQVIANVLGHSNTNANVLLNRAFLPIQSSLPIVMVFGKTSTNYYATTNGLDGLAGYISQPKFGSCEDDSGQNVLETYQSFCGLSSLPSGITKTTGTTVTFGNYWINITSGVAGTVNVIYFATPNTVENNTSLYALMNMTYSGLGSVPIGSRIGITGTATSSSTAYMSLLGANTSKGFIGVDQGTTSRFLTPLLSKVPTFYGISIDQLKSPTILNFSVSFSNIGSASDSGSQSTSNVVVGTSNFTKTSLGWLGIGISPPGDQMPSAASGLQPVTPLTGGNGILDNYYTSHIYAFRAIGIDNGDAGIIPFMVNSTTLQIQINPAPSATNFSEAHTSVLIGNHQKLNASILGGSPPYTFNFLVYNSINQLVYNALITTSGISNVTNTISFQITSAMGTGTYVANVIISDNATTPESLTNSITFTVSGSTSISAPSNAVVDGGQYQSVTVTTSSSLSPYTYNFLVVNAITNSIVTNGLFKNVAASSYTFTFLVPSSYTTNSPLEVNAILTDSGSVTQNTIDSNEFTVNNQMVANPVTATNLILDNGQFTTLNHHDSGGTNPKSFQWYGNTIAGATAICDPTNAIGGATAATYTPQPAMNTLYWVNITDSASTPASVCSAGLQITVYTSLSTPTITASNTPNVHAGAYELFSAYVSGGTTPYTTYNFLVYNSVTNIQIANMLTSSNTFLWLVPSVDVGNTIYANVIVTDSASTPAIANSLQTSTITISNTYLAPTVVISAPSNSIVDAGQYQSFTATVTNGDSPFTYNFLSYAAVTLPANIIYYAPITLTNGQTTAYTANTPVMITVNSLRYQTYESSTLTNIEFFYANGTIIPSWLEGNLLNEQQTTNLYTSQNTVYWLKVVNTLLPATSSNTIYMGFANTGTSLLTGVNTGEAPQLSCSDATQPSTCNGVYAQYDNGNSIFNIYDNFGGNTLSSNWNQVGIENPSGAVVDNGITLTPGLIIGDSFSWNTPSLNSKSNPFNLTVESYLKSSAIGNNDLGVSYSNLETNAPLIKDTNFTDGSTGFFSQTTLNIRTHGTNSAFTVAQYVTNSFVLVSLAFPYSSSANSYATATINYTQHKITSSNSITNNPSNLIYPGIVVTSAGNYLVDNSFTVFAQWFRVRTIPYNNIMPSVSFGSIATATNSISYSGISTASKTGTYYISTLDTSNSPEYGIITLTDANPTTVSSSPSNTYTINAALSTPTITPSPSGSVAAGSTEVFTASFTGGSSSYTYNFLVFNSITNTILGNYLITNTLTSNSFGWLVPAADVGNTIEANVVITDSASTPTSTTSPQSSTITITSSYTAPTVLISSPSNAILDVGQAQTFTATITGGTAPFTYKFIAFNSISNTITNSITFSSVGSSTQTWTYIPNAQGTTNSPIEANVQITDAHPTTVSSVNSISFTVNPSLVLGAITPSSPSINNGQSITLSASSVTGGSGTVTLYWFQGASCNTYLSGQTGGIGTPLTVSPASTTTYSYNVVDSASTPVSLCSSPDTVTVNPAIVPLPTVTASNTVVDVGQYITFNGAINMGTTPYTYNFVIVNSIFTDVYATCVTFGSTGNGCLSGTNSLDGFTNSIVINDAHIFVAPATSNFNLYYLTAGSNPAQNAMTINSEINYFNSNSIPVLLGLFGASNGNVLYHPLMNSIVENTADGNAMIANIITALKGTNSNLGTGSAYCGVEVDYEIDNPGDSDMGGNYINWLGNLANSMSSNGICNGNPIMEVVVQPFAIRQPTALSPNGIAIAKALKNLPVTGRIVQTFNVSLNNVCSGNFQCPGSVYYTNNGIPNSMLIDSFDLTTPWYNYLPQIANAVNTGIGIGSYGNFDANILWYNTLANALTMTTIANALYTGVSTSSNTFTLKITQSIFNSLGSPYQIRGFLYTADSASTPDQSVSKTAMITINPALNLPELISSPSGTANLDVGQFWNLTAIITDVPITITNGQTSSYLANTPIMLTVNSLAYKAYESSTLSNIAFFYANGTIIPSWLEGNLLNEQQTTNLYTSENTIYWLKITNTILPASSSNVIYMGFASNTISLMNGVFTGEAGLLDSCSNDNGANVFSYYQSFCGLSSLPSNWYNSLGTSESYQPTYANIITGTLNSVNGISTNSPLSANTPGNILEGLLNIPIGCNTICGFVGTFSTNTPATALSSAQYGIGQGSASGLRTSIQQSVTTTGATIYPTPSVYSILEYNSITGNFFNNYISIITRVNLGTNSGRYLSFLTSNNIGQSVYWIRTRVAPPNNITASTSFAIISAGTTPYTYNFVIYNSITNTMVATQLGSSSFFNYQIPSGEASNTLYANVFITDSASTPATVNSVLSSVKTISAALSTPTLTVSILPTISPGAIEVFTASFTGGTSGYTYNFLVFNSITNTLLGNYLVTNTFTSNAFGWLVPSADVGNTFYANVLITDSASTPTSSNSINRPTTSSVLITSSYTAPTVTITPPSNAIVDVGQYESFTATVSGGTSPYTYNFLASNSITDAINNNGLFTPIGGVTEVWTNQVGQRAVANSPLVANIILTDANPTTVNSIYSSSYIVNAQLNPVSISATNTPYLDTSQYDVFSGSISGGGSPPYTYNFLVYNSVTNQLLANDLVTSSAILVKFIWQVPVADAGNTIYANVILNDSATTNAMSISGHSTVQTINAIVTTPAITSSNALIDYGQYIKLTATVSAGTLPYTYNILVFNSITNAILANSLLVGVIPTTETYTIPLPSTLAGNTIAFNVVVTDGATTNVISASTISYLGFNALPLAGAITPSSPTINSGQSQMLTSHASLGTSPYTYNWYAQANCGGASQATGTTYSPSPSSTTTYSYSVTDSATTAVVVCSASDTVTVNGALVAGAITATNTVINNGQYTLTTSHPLGGTTPYTAYQWYTGAACTSAIGGATSSTYLANPTSATTYYYKVTDTASATACSAGLSITVNSALGIPTLIASNSPNVNNGQYELFSAYVTGGTTAYTYNFKVYNSVTNILVASSSQSANTFLWQVNGNSGNTINANVVVTDSATTNSITNSILTTKITVGGSLSALLSSSQPSVAQGQSVTLTATASGGTSPYTYNWFTQDPNGAGYYKIVGATSSFYIWSNTVIKNTWQFIVQVRDNIGTVVNSPVLNVNVSGAPIFVGTIPTSMVYEQPYNIQATGDPSGDTVSLFITPLGQAQGNALTSQKGVLSYTLCSGANYCPTIGAYTVNLIDITSGADPTSNFLVYAPVYLKNVTGTANIFSYSPLSATCSNNWISGSCTGNVIYNTNAVLTNDIFINGNLTINSGQTLWENGYAIVTNGNFVITGTLNANTIGNGEIGAPESCTSTNTTAASIYTSYGGSGGGSSGAGFSCYGGNTIAPGGLPGVDGSPGYNAIPPIVTSSNVIQWFSSINKYLGGAGGGYGDSKGGSGADGILIEANVISGSGTISCNGGNGVNGGVQGSAGGGGCAMVLIYATAKQSFTTSNSGGTASTIGSGGLGGAGGAGQVVSYQGFPIPISTITDTYPIRIFGNVTNSTLSYTANQIYNGIKTNIAQYVSSLNYTPSSNQLSGLYFYNITEHQYANVIYINQSVLINMTSITSALTFNTPIIQYFPNFVLTPTFTINPIRWYIKSDIASNNPANTITGDQFSNANMIINTNNDIFLVYNGFPAFAINLTNNPSVQTSITQTQFKILASNSIPTAPYQRAIANVSSYNQRNFNTLIANTTSSYTLFINNYSILSSASWESNTFRIYAPNSLYQNPIISINATSISTVAPTYATEINNYCPSTLTNGEYSIFNTYSPDSTITTTNATNYNFNINLGAQFLPAGFYLLVNEQSPKNGSLVQIQSSKIPGGGVFALPLQNTIPYSFRISNCTSVIYSTGLAVQISPIGITIPTISNITPAYNYTFHGNCGQFINVSQPNWPSIRCNGTSTNNGVSIWTIDVYNATSLLGLETLLNQTNITGTSFTYTYPMKNRNITYSVKVLAQTGNAKDPLQFVTSWISTNTSLNLMDSGGAILALLFFFIFAFLGYARKTLGLIIIDLGLYMGGALDILPIQTVPFYGILVVSIVLIFIFERGE